LADLKLPRHKNGMLLLQRYELYRFSADVASKIARLTLRASITRKIDLEDWKNILREGIKHKREALEKEVDSIHEKSSNECSCASGLDGEQLEQCLIEKGRRVKLTNIEEFYHPTPLEILEERLAKEDVPDEEAEELVMDHTEFIRNYILTSKNRDQAYYQWVYDKFPSLRLKIDPEQIRHLDALLIPNDI